MQNDSYKTLIDCAAGRIPADLVLENCQIIHVFTGEIATGNVAVIDGTIAGIGANYEGKTRIDLNNKYLAPGFIEGHIHIESSMLVPAQFAAAVLPHGTTTVICDPHEIANVCGITGIDFMLETDSPLSIYAMAPSCVPATHMETSGASLTAQEIRKVLDHPRVIGLAEMMNFPGIVYAVPDVLEKTLLAQNRGCLIDGHAPGLSGSALQAYIAAGISSDHECTTLEEAREKIRAGMAVFIREGTTAHNLEELLPIIQSPASHHCLLVTDDRHADDLLEHGHLDYILAKAVALGADPVTALQMVTLNVARHFGLQKTGAIVPGYKADLVVLENLDSFTVDTVFVNGKKIASHNEACFQTKHTQLSSLDRHIQSSVKVLPDHINLSIPAKTGLIRLIQCTGSQLVTDQTFIEPTVENETIVSDPARDILKIAVIERHQGSGRVGLGFVQGLGIQNGAIASTVAHDSHNLVVVGSSDQAMMTAIRKITTMQGGLVVAGDEVIHAALALPVAGLMSIGTADEVSKSLHRLHKALDEIKTSVHNPFMLLSFLALPVIPVLKITDMGLVDVGKFEIVSLQEQKKSKK
jgi:adenine deaminase